MKNGDLQSPEAAALDPRQRRSRMALFAALDALLAETDAAAIRVSDLAARAGVGRQTFYRHFSGVDDMLRVRLLDDLADQRRLASELSGLDDEDERVRRIVEFAFERVADQPRVYQAILRGEGGASALSLFREQIGSFLADGPDAGAHDRGPASYEAYVASFHAGAIGAMLSHWLEAGREPDIATMGEFFLRMAKSQPRPPKRKP